MNNTIIFSLILSLTSLVAKAQTVVMDALDAPNTKVLIASYQKDFQRNNCQKGYGEIMTYQKDVTYTVAEYATPEEKEKEAQKAMEKAKQLVENEGQDFVNNIGQCLDKGINISESFVAMRNVYESIQLACSSIVVEKEIKAYSNISQQDAEEKADKLVEQFNAEQTAKSRSGGCLHTAPDLLLAKCQFTYGHETLFVMFNFFKLFPAYVKRDAYNNVIETVFLGDDTEDPYYKPESNFYEEPGKSSMYQWCRDKVAEAGGEIITEPGGKKVFLSGFRVEYLRDIRLNFGINELSEQDREDLDAFRNDLWWHWYPKYWGGPNQSHYLDFYSTPDRVWTGDSYGYVQGDHAPPACSNCVN